MRFTHILVLLVWCCLALSPLHAASDKSTTPSIAWSHPPTSALPVGVSHRTFHSALVQQDIGYCVYLPPGYEENSEKRYPVLYHLHGNGGDELRNVKDAELLAEGIASGRWPAMIMIFPNGGRSTMYKNSADGLLPIESIFMTELIPHVDATYRTIADRTGRCIEGFSMGGRGSTHLAITYPTMFCSLFCQAGNVPHLLEDFDKGTLSAMLGDKRETYVANDVYTLLEKNVEVIKKNVRIQIACGTRDSGHLATIRDFHAALVKLDIDHTYIELEGLGHQKNKMIETMRPIWFDYHTESLRRSGVIK